MVDKDITLRLRPYGLYSITSMGVFFHTEHGFRVFVKKDIMKEINKKVT